MVDFGESQYEQEALRLGEHDLRLIVDSSPGLVATMTARGDIEFVNQEWLDYLGKTLAELRGSTSCGIVQPDDLSSVLATWTRSGETGQPYDSECGIRRADGVYRWFQGRALPLRDTVNPTCTRVLGRDK